jgi:4-hydroxybenzoate polyprenyltransferase
MSGTEAHGESPFDPDPDPGEQGRRELADAVPTSSPAPTPQPPPPPRPRPRPPKSKAAAWLQLLRLPNLFTVPGDPLAGYVLASGIVPFLMNHVEWDAIKLLGCMAVSILLYSAGLVLNDVMDLAEDRRERPYRPLPSGAISRRAAIAAFFLLAMAALAIAYLLNPHTLMPLTFAAALLGVILIYDCIAKGIPIVGPLNMGLCRGLSLLLGASVIGWENWDQVAVLPVIISAFDITLYIAAVTAIAAGETSEREIGLIRYAPVVIVAAWFASLYLYIIAPYYHQWVFERGLGPHCGDSISLNPFYLIIRGLIVGMTIAFLLHLGKRLKGRPGPHEVQKAIGGFILLLLPLQAAMVALGGLPGLIAAAVFLAVFLPLAKWIGRRFRAS